MSDILSKLRLDYPHIKFVQGNELKWSSANSQITYLEPMNPKDIWGIMHELGHAILGHKLFTSDAALLAMERAAWNKGIEIAKQYGISIESDYVEDCLDTYRNWRHTRSICKVCTSTTIQATKTRFICLNCGAESLI